MKKIVFILLIFCSFLVVWGCNKNKTKCVPQKEATSDSSMRSNDDTLSLMIEHEVDDVDYGVIIKRGDKTIHRFGYKYPEDDDLVPNEERIDSCLLTDLNFDGIKDTLNDSVFGSLYVEKMKYDKNVYIVHLQTDSLHIQRPYTLTKQGGKMKISAIGKRKLPMVFCNDTLWIKDSPQCIDEFNKWHGVAISTNYDVVDSLKLAKDFRVAILSPNFDSWKDAPIPPICSDRLLLVEYKNKQEVYDNVIGNGEPTGGWLPYEMLVKPWEDKTTDFVERSDFILSYGDGNGYKIYYTIGIKMIEGKAYVTGIKWEEHDSGLSFRKQIVQEYDGKQMPLSSYSRCMPWELSQE